MRKLPCANKWFGDYAFNICTTVPGIKSYCETAKAAIFLMT